MELECALESLVPDDSVWSTIGNFALDQSRNQLVSFLEQVPMEQPQEPAAAEKPSKKRAATDASLVRQTLAEMRALDVLTCDTVLSTGERVGEFLLRRWKIDEAKKK